MKARADSEKGPLAAAPPDIIPMRQQPMTLTANVAAGKAIAPNLMMRAPSRRPFDRFHFPGVLDASDAA